MGPKQAVKSLVAHDGHLTTRLGPVKGKGDGQVDLVCVGRGAPLGIPKGASAKCR